MFRIDHRVWAATFLVSLVVFPYRACNAEEVDPAVVGTWHLQWPGQPIYWEIRANGTYEFSGPGVPAGHAGSFRAAAGKWSLSTTGWEDGGTYQLPNPNIFFGVGKLGPGTWVRAARLPNAPTTPARQALSADRTRTGSDSRPASRPGMTAEEEAAYIADYNAQWERAERGIRALMQPARPRPSSSESTLIGDGSSSWSPSSGTPYDDGSSARKESERNAAEARAYWNYNASDYNRIKNGECTWSDSVNIGC